jgi:hypothetical protein
VEGHPIEIGNFSQRFARLRQKELDDLISIAPEKLQPYVELRILTNEHVESVVRLLECRETRLFTHDRIFRENVIRFLKDETDDFLGVFGKAYGLSEPRPKPPKDEFKPPVSEAEPPVVEHLIKPPQAPDTPPTVDRPVPHQDNKEKCINAGESLKGDAKEKSAAVEVAVGGLAFLLIGMFLMYIFHDNSFVGVVASLFFIAIGATSIIVSIVGP